MVPDDSSLTCLRISSDAAPAEILHLTDTRAFETLLAEATQNWCHVLVVPDCAAYVAARLQAGDMPGPARTGWHILAHDLVALHGRAPARVQFAARQDWITHPKAVLAAACKILGVPLPALPEPVAIAVAVPADPLSRLVAWLSRQDDAQTDQLEGALAAICLSAQGAPVPVGTTTADLADLYETVRAGFQAHPAPQAETDGLSEIGVLRATNTLLLDQLAAVQETAEKYVTLAQSTQKQGKITETRLAGQTVEVARLTALTGELTLQRHAHTTALAAAQETAAASLAAQAGLKAQTATLEQQKRAAEAEIRQLNRDREELGAARDDLRLVQTNLTQEIRALQDSTSWRLTAPLRAVSRTIGPDRR